MWRRCNCLRAQTSRAISKRRCKLVNVAADRGAQYVQLPEYFNFLVPSRDFANAAESVPGPTTIRMAELAGHAP